MMMLPTGSKADNGNKGGRARGFTLVELILVMAMLLIVMSVAAPSLSNFFRGRNLDVETRRFISLTRYGQDRAVAEGIPMVLWIDSEGRAYGLHADETFSTEDDREVDYDLARDLEIEVVQGAAPTNSLALMSSSSSANSGQEIHFLPTGFLKNGSPERIILRDGDREEVWIGLGRGRLRYEVETNIYHRNVQP